VVLDFVDLFFLTWPLFILLLAAFDFLPGRACLVGSLEPFVLISIAPPPGGTLPSSSSSEESRVLGYWTPVEREICLFGFPPFSEW
jgi:hypothetical protein